MRHDDLCTITRTTTIKDPKTHIASSKTQTFEPFNCRLGRTSGTLVQATQGIFTQQLRIYIPNILANIKSGDIATIGTAKYTVGNPYKSNKHHIEADVVYKEEV